PDHQGNRLEPQTQHQDRRRPQIQPHAQARYSRSSRAHKICDPREPHPFAGHEYTRFGSGLGVANRIFLPPVDLPVPLALISPAASQQQPPALSLTWLERLTDGIHGTYFARPWMASGSSTDPGLRYEGTAKDRSIAVGPLKTFISQTEGEGAWKE